MSSDNSFIDDMMEGVNVDDFEQPDPDVDYSGWTKYAKGRDFSVDYLLRYVLTHPEIPEQVAADGFLKLDLTMLHSDAPEVFDELRETPDNGDLQFGRSIPQSVVDICESGEPGFVAAKEYCVGHMLTDFEVSMPSEFPDTTSGSESWSIRYVNPPEEMCINIGHGNTDQFGKLVSIAGMVTQTSKQNPKLTDATYVCEYCGDTVTLDATGLFKLETLEEGVDECPTCEMQGLKQDMSRSVMKNYQQLKIQEPAGSAVDPSDPATIKTELLGDHLLGHVRGGDNVSAIGYLRHFSEEGSTVVETYVEAVQLNRDDESFDDLEVTDADIEASEQFARRDDALDVFAENIAPHIVGHDEAKRALALQLMGARSTKGGDRPKGGEINVLFIGEPSTGKSDLLDAANDLSPLSNMTSGTGSTGVGLTATAVREEIAGKSEWVAKAGLMVLSDGGLICIDEFDKISDDGKSQLNDALERGEVPVTKASINTKLSARVSALVAANPVGGSFDRYDTDYLGQFNLTTDFVSRFDIVYTFFDDADEELDEAKIDSVLANRTGAGVAADEDLSTEFMRAHIAHARATCDPKMTEEAAEYIKGVYTTIRTHLSNPETGETGIDTRKGRAMAKLAEAAARFRLSDEVELQDAKLAVRIVRDSMKEIHKDKHGNVDLNTVLEGTVAELRGDDEDEESGDDE